MVARKNVQKRVKTRIQRTFKNLWPISRWTVLVVVLALCFCSAVSAFVIAHAHYSSGNALPVITATNQSPMSAPHDANSGQTQSTQTQTSTSPTKNSMTATTSNLPDADGCIPNTSGYQSCHTASAQIKFMNQCSADMKAANDNYYAIYNPQWNSYNNDVNTKRQEFDSLIGTEPGYTPGWAAGVWLSYEHDRAQQFNSAVKPAYITYDAMSTKINARGCNVTKTWPDPSLPF